MNEFCKNKSSAKFLTKKISLTFLKSQRGQGMTEYIIIVALIAVAAIGVYQFFGQVVRSQMAGIASEVGGVDGAAARAKATSAATAATTNEIGKKGLNSYDGAAIAAGAQ